jgi:hypothetical protein
MQTCFFSNWHSLVVLDQFSFVIKSRFFEGEKWNLNEIEKSDNFGQLFKLGGLDWSQRDLDRDLDLDTEKKLVSTVEIISTVSKS